MIVEDEPDLYDMLMAMSSVLGVDEVAFSTGEEAITWIEEVEDGHFEGELPVLALLDIRLPGDVDGVDVGERLRQSPLLNNIAVVLMTAYHLSPSDEQIAIERSQADHLIHKPLPAFTELRDLLSKIAKERLKNSQRPSRG
jgi:CheY-like chemotaxis protein